MAHLTSNSWYYSIDDSRQGPVDYEELRRIVLLGKLGKDDLVWTAGMSEWNLASTVEGLFPPSVASPPRPPLRPIPIQTSPRNAHSSTAGATAASADSKRSKAPAERSRNRKALVVIAGIAACAVIALLGYTFLPTHDAQPNAATSSASANLTQNNLLATATATAPPAAAHPSVQIPPASAATSPSTNASSSAADHCEADAPSAQGPEETTLIANGHRYLTSKALRAGAHGEIFVVKAALGYDGQCRPDPYQIYVFNNGKQVGTLSPNAMHARSDGAITEFKLLDADHLQFEVDHYKTSDPACCASSHEEKIVSLSQLASPQAGNAQDNPHALAQASQITSQGIATLEQVSARMLWTQTDSGKEVNWVEAKSFCSAQGAGWRLPSTNELGDIFDQSGTTTTSCGTFTCKVSPLFRLSAGGYWTNVEVGQSGARVFALDGGTTYQGQKDGRGNVRALCVKPTTASDATETRPVQVAMESGTPPSFDCRRATTITENAICASAELSSLDGQLGQVFSDVIATATASPAHMKNVRAEQVAWIKARNDECQGNASCLGASLRKRTAELISLMAEHSSIAAAQEKARMVAPTESPSPLANVNSSPTKQDANSATPRSTDCQSYAKDISRLRGSGGVIDNHIADRLEFARSLQGCK